MEAVVLLYLKSGAAALYCKTQARNIGAGRTVIPRLQQSAPVLWRFQSN